MNTQLILAARDQIVAHPDLLCMDQWVRRRVLRGDGAVEGAECNTTACIAGWIVTVGRKLRDPEAVARMLDQEQDFDVESQATLAARLNQAEADRLFYIWHWPDDLHMEYGMATTPEARADVVRRRIDLFVESNGEK